MMRMMMIIFSDIFITLLYFYDCYPWVKNLLQDAKNPVHTLAATSAHTHTYTHTQQLAQHSLTLSHTHACARWASFFHLMSKPLVFERLCKKESGQNFHLHTWCVFFFFRLVFFYFELILNFFYYFFLMWILITRHFQHRFKLFGNFFGAWQSHHE